MSKYASFKATERRIARELGGRRVGHLGGADVETDHVSVEVKHRASIPDWLKEAVAQAQRNADGGKLPIVLLHEHGASGNEDLVVICWTDWLANVSSSS